MQEVWELVANQSHYRQRERTRSRTDQSLWPWQDLAKKAASYSAVGLKQTKEQATAVELIASTWDVIPEGIQTKLTALGYGPPPQEEPELTGLLKSHMTALPQEVQAVVTELTQPLPDTEKELAQKLKVLKHRWET